MNDSSNLCDDVVANDIDVDYIKANNDDIDDIVNIDIEVDYIEVNNKIVIDNILAFLI
jgi:hypothetical protein